MDDAALMREALVEAQAAYERGECAVGAVLVRDGEIVARAGPDGDKSFPRPGPAHRS